MYLVGLTGKIASGKSLASSYFQSQGIGVISADVIAREIVSPGSEILAAIVSKFGDCILNDNKELNRPLLRSLIFQSKKARIWLNQLTHPVIQTTIQAKAKIAARTSPYVIIEIPLLASRLEYPYLNRVILITARRTLLIARIMHRDHCSKQQALTIIKSQPSDSSRKKIADDWIENNHKPAVFLEKLKLLHNRYLQLAYERS